MDSNFKKYLLIIMIFGISFISIGVSLFLMLGGKNNFIKNRLSASVVDTVPSGSTITDSEFYAELVDSYNAEKGTSYGYDHVFTDSELASLETLILDEYGPNYHGHAITDLSGLSYLSGLKNLVMHLSQITTVDLSNKASLINVDLDIPTLNKLILVGDDNLASLNTSKPSSIGYIVVDKGRDISYLFGSPVAPSTIINDNSFGIVCDKYNLTVGETASCMVKGKTTVEISGIIFKALTNNGNISISNYSRQILQGSKHVEYYGEPVQPGEFDIVSFTVTAVSPGTSKLYLADYDEYNHIGYIKNDDEETPIIVSEEISRMFYVDKYKVVNAGGTEVTTGNLETNYGLNIINDNGEYIPAYVISVLGDVRADGIINMRDVTKAFKGGAKGNFTTYTPAEKIALDMNFDGLYKITDVIDIYDSMDGE